MSFFFCEILLVGNSNILNSWTTRCTKNWLGLNGILNLAQPVNRLFINRELCVCLNFVKSSKGGEMPAWHSCSHSQDLKAVGVAQNILKIHLYEMHWFLLVVINSCARNGNRLHSLKRRENTPKPPSKAPTLISAALQAVTEVLCCHIFGQQYLCHFGNKPKDFNKVQTCPSNKRLIRGNGSGF